MHFDGVVFGGGGCRCFWQAGFWATVAAPLGLEPRVISAVSAGAAFACTAIGGNTDTVVAEFVRQTARNKKNFYPRNLVGSRRAFPHEKIYRDTILNTTDEAMLARLRKGPEIRVLLARPPRRLGTRFAVGLGLATYQAEKMLRPGVHPTWPQRLGFRGTVVSAADCESPQALADLILQSSCMPPLTSVQRRDGNIVVDGAVIDPAPASLLSDAPSTLVLLTGRYADLPQQPGRLYVQPSQPVPIAMWDYASPELVQAAFDLGRRDGDAFVRDAAPRHAER